MSILELKAITMDFPGVRALDGVSFDLRKGEIHALCGENGAGKSSLIKVLCGVHRAGAYQGEIWLKGQRVEFRSLRAAEKRGIAVIAQELALVPDLSVAENMFLGREPVRGGLIRWDLVREGAQRALERVGLRVDPDRRIRDLGIGEQQLVEIAKALLKDAEILVLDEPTAALAEVESQSLLRLLRSLSGRGVSCVYISHRLEEVFDLADRVTVLRDGRSISTDATGDLTPERVIERMVGRELKGFYPRPPAPTGPVALEVRRWSVAHPDIPGRAVLKDVSFSVRQGEVLGIGGLMGAGRTALLTSLFGAARSPATGELRMFGWSAARGPFRSPREAIAEGLALVTEDRKRLGLVLEASVLENMTLASLGQFSRRGMLDDGRRRSTAQSLFESLRIRAPSLLAPVGRLSGGNQQKVVLGKWIMAAPRVLLLDEPTRGIDIGAKGEIYEVVKRFAAEGLAVLLVSSDLPELLGMSHRVLVLSQGQETACLDHESATPERFMEAATQKMMS